MTWLRPLPNLWLSVPRWNSHDLDVAITLTFLSTTTISKQKARVTVDHGPAKFLLLRQPGFPRGTRGFPSHDYSWFGFIGNLSFTFRYLKKQLLCQCRIICFSNSCRVDFIGLLIYRRSSSPFLFRHYSVASMVLGHRSTLCFHKLFS